MQTFFWGGGGGGGGGKGYQLSNQNKIYNFLVHSSSVRHTILKTTSLQEMNEVS